MWASLSASMDNLALAMPVATQSSPATTHLVPGMASYPDCSPNGLILWQTMLDVANGGGHSPLGLLTAHATNIQGVEMG